MSAFMHWLRCHLSGRCGDGMTAAERERLDELKRYTRRAEYQAAVLRRARERGQQFPSWEQLIPEGRDRGPR